MWNPGRCVCHACSLFHAKRKESLKKLASALRASAPGDDEKLKALLRRALPGMWSEDPAAGSMTLRRPGAARLRLHVSPVGDAEADFGGRRVARWC